MERFKKPLLATVGLLLMLTAGCGPEGGPQSGGGPQTGAADRGGPTAPGGEGGGSADLVLPLHDYELSASQYARVQRARMTAVQECMRRFGIDLEVPAIRQVRWSHTPALVHRLGDREPARYGYRGPLGYQADQYASITRGGTKALFVPTKYGGVYDGSIRVFDGRVVPPGGCQGEVTRRLDRTGAKLRKELGDDSVIPWKPLADIEAKIAGKVSADRRYQEAVGRWKRCMNRSGRPFDSPDAAEADPRWVASVSITEEEADRPVGRPEIETAVTDEKCRDEANLTAVSLALHTTYQKEEIKENATRLGLVRKLLLVQLRNSARMVP
ncbi:hypothetical protein OG949_00640 [Streptomyces scopuliridis]|uniref:hypothetical protein n=1 Tax=Streptomyces scopuliridis TaxID=452529 RepID=UPI002DD8F980|nr:hypothetical protein [Streptomyces scopuliridis]WSB31537.1 hypothetical protein OG949_00640 [Streptomyces scopuliridis]